MKLFRLLLAFFVAPTWGGHMANRCFVCQSVAYKMLSVREKLLKDGETTRDVYMHMLADHQPMCKLNHMMQVGKWLDISPNLATKHCKIAIPRRPNGKSWELVKANIVNGDSYEVLNNNLCHESGVCGFIWKPEEYPWLKDANATRAEL